MTRLVVTSCGTSVLTNAVPESERKRLTALANARELTAPEDRSFLDHCVRLAREQLSAERSDPRRLSAELNGLLTFCGGRLPREDLHLLIVTDTALGRAAAGLLAEWMERQTGAAAQRLEPRDLALRSSEELRWGLVSLMKELEPWLGQYPETCFNLSGGFKSINGYLQAVAMLHRAEIFYMFEGAREIVCIPRLPLTLDPELFCRQPMLLRRLAIGLPVAASEARKARLPEALWLEASGGAALSEWGQLLWERARPELYRETLLEPPPPIRLGLDRGNVEKRFRTLLETINRRIDQLAEYLQGGSGPAPVSLRGLDFKALEGDPRPPATHEFDITHSHGALRGFGYFEDGGFVICDIDWHD